MVSFDDAKFCRLVVVLSLCKAPITIQQFFCMLDDLKCPDVYNICKTGVNLLKRSSLSPFILVVQVISQSKRLCSYAFDTARIS